MRNRRGMTLIEMLIALTVFSIVLAGALGFMSTGRPRASTRAPSTWGCSRT